MKSGDVIVTPLPQADGVRKNRPALVLGAMRPYGDLLVCGISTQRHAFVDGFDETLSPGDPDFSAAGLTAPSLIRLGFLSTIPLSEIKGRIGTVSGTRHQRLLGRLAAHLAGLARQG